MTIKEIIENNKCIWNNCKLQQSSKVKYKTIMELNIINSLNAKDGKHLIMCTNIRKKKLYRIIPNSKFKVNSQRHFKGRIKKCDKWKTKEIPTWKRRKIPKLSFFIKKEGDNAILTNQSAVTHLQNLLENHIKMN